MRVHYIHTFEPICVHIHANMCTHTQAPKHTRTYNMTVRSLNDHHKYLIVLQHVLSLYSAYEDDTLAQFVTSSLERSVRRINITYTNTFLQIFTRNTIHYFQSTDLKNTRTNYLPRKK